MWPACPVPEPIWCSQPSCAFSLMLAITCFLQIYLFSMPVKEFQIVEFFLGTALKDEVMKIMPVQKQTRAGQRTRFKARLSPCSCRASYACAVVSSRSAWGERAALGMFFVSLSGSASGKHAQMQGALLCVKKPWQPCCMSNAMVSCRKMNPFPCHISPHSDGCFHLQAFVCVGDHNGHVGLGVKCAKEVRGRFSALRASAPVSMQNSSARLCTAHAKTCLSVHFIKTFHAPMQVATAIRGAIIQAKMSCVPVRRGYWGNKIGKVCAAPGRRRIGKLYSCSTTSKSSFRIGNANAGAFLV